MRWLDEGIAWPKTFPGRVTEGRWPHRAWGPVSKYEVARRGSGRAGLWPVLLGHFTELTGEDYVRQQAWRSATLSSCPLHPEGRCGFKRNGTRGRKHPEGMRLQRYYCPQGQTTFSLVPVFLAARVSGTLLDIEGAVAAVEKGTSIETTAGDLRPGSDLPGAVRWTRRRIRWVSAVLHTAAGLLPEVLAGCELTVLALRSALGVDSVLVHLRALLATHIQSLPGPVGFSHLQSKRGYRGSRRQHSAGPDPPRRKG